VHSAIIEKLYNDYKLHGYVTEQNVFKIVEENDIPLFDIEYICDQLLSKGVIIRDDDIDNEEDDDFDRSSTDYSKIYSDILEIDSSLMTFIEYIKGIQPPQHREWQNLLPQAKNGNVYARTRISEMYMRVALKMALSFAQKYGFPIADVIQDALMGLIIAIDKFEFGKQDHFNTYFPFWIRQSMYRESANYQPIVVPVHQNDLMLELIELYSNHHCENCVYDLCPSFIQEASLSLQCDADKISTLLKLLKPLESLDTLIETEETSYEVLIDEDFENCINDELFGKDTRTAIETVLSTLTPREEMVIKLRFGFTDGRPHTLEEIAQKFSITRERIRQIEAKALRKLRHPSRARYIKHMLDYFN